MNSEALNLSKLLHFTESLCAFADNVQDRYECTFNIKIDDDKFKFTLPELIAETRKYRQAVIDDIETCANDEHKCEHKPIFDESFVPDFTTKKTSSDEIVSSDFDYIRETMPDTVKKIFDLVLPLSIIEEEKAYGSMAEPVSKEKRIKAIEMHAMLKLAQIATS